MPCQYTWVPCLSFPQTPPAFTPLPQHTPAATRNPHPCHTLPFTYLTCSMLKWVSCHSWVLPIWAQGMYQMRKWCSSRTRTQSTNQQPQSRIEDSGGFFQHGFIGKHLSAHSPAEPSPSCSSTTKIFSTPPDGITRMFLPPSAGYFCSFRPAHTRHLSAALQCLQNRVQVGNIKKDE